MMPDTNNINTSQDCSIEHNYMNVQNKPYWANAYGFIINVGCATTPFSKAL